jgi:alkylation response protein AidB-like acyl-CoA dehydrogenase
MWASNSGGWDDHGADLECVVCRYSQDGSPQDPSSNPADVILILLVTRDIIAKNSSGAYKVLGHAELPGHSSTAGPHIRFTDFRVPDYNLLAAPGKGASIILQCFTATAALVGMYISSQPSRLNNVVIFFVRWSMSLTSS